jgi:CspA family cold shock protein
MSRQFGKVAWFSAPKGFGFITPDGEGKSDIFCHFSQIVMEGYRTLDPGVRVSFEVGENHKGPMAVNVKLEDESKK